MKGRVIKSPGLAMTTTFTASTIQLARNGVGHIGEYFSLFLKVIGCRRRPVLGKPARGLFQGVYDLAHMKVS